MMQGPPKGRGSLGCRSLGGGALGEPCGTLWETLRGTPTGAVMRRRRRNAGGNLVDGLPPEAPEAGDSQDPPFLYTQTPKPTRPAPQSDYVGEIHRTRPSCTRRPQSPQDQHPNRNM